MGELLLCRESIAAMPFYIEGMSLNIYSIEELSFYIWQNTYLIERDFISEDLINWIEKEIGRVKLADKLRSLIRVGGKNSELISAILKESGYCTEQEMRSILAIIAEMEEKSDFECNKIRADRLMENDRILSAIYEYKRLLDSEDAEHEEKSTIGRIWHNLGAAYAKLFLFELAIKCFENAYELYPNDETLKEWLFGYRCLHDEAGFIKVAMEHGLSEQKMQEIRNELSLNSQSDENQAFEQQIAEIAADKGEEAFINKQRNIRKIIFDWKEEYRRICRV